MAATGITRVAIAVVLRDGHCLVGRRPEGKPLAGYAEFPGGKCDDGEAFAEAAVRECLEETGLHVLAEVELLRQDYAYPHGVLDMSFWKCRLAEEAELAATGGFRWVSLADLKSLTFPPANEAVLSLLHTHDPATAQPGLNV